MPGRPHSMPESDLKVQEDIEEFFGIQPCLWQIRVARAVLAGDDVVTIAPTGLGKSLTYWIPLRYITNGIIVAIAPLKQLGTQFSAKLKNHVTAVSITASNATNELFEQLAQCRFRVILVSPEILNNDSRFEDLWSNKKFTNNLINIVLDEAHCVKDWGGTFRSDYLKIGPIRYLLTRKPTVGFHLGTATMPPALLPEVCSNLHLRPDHTTTIRLSTDCPNICFVVRRMEHPLGSYHDLAFIIQLHLAAVGSSTFKFLVFFNSRREAQEGAEFLRKQLPQKLRDKIKWIHSGMTDEFREDELHALLVGDVFGDTATDAAGMGIDIPDVKLTAQYRVPRDLSTWIQRAGRAGRDPTLNATAVLLAEPCFFDDTKGQASKKVQKRLANNQLHRGQLKKRRTNTTNSVLHDPTKDIMSTTESQVDRAMIDFVNAENRPEKCRRQIANKALGNLNLTPVVYRFCCPRCAPRTVIFCCDLCHPDHWKPPPVPPYTKAPRRPNKYTPTPFVMSSREQDLHSALLEMCRALASETFPQGGFLGPQAIMSTALLNRIVSLAHYRKITSLETLREQVSWAFLDSHGPKILGLIQQSCPPPMTSSLFTTAPLQRQSNNLGTSNLPPTSTSGTTTRVIQNKPKCKVCGLEGHNVRTCPDSRAETARQLAASRRAGQENVVP